MPLEATMICVDNSEASRNGDYLPTRFQAQSEAVSLIFNAKTQANPESAVGLLSMAGTSPQVLNTPTTNFGAVLAGLHETKIKGSIRLGTAISVAMLALKHRANKSQRQRVIVLTCSEIDSKDGNDSEKELIKLAKKCKKNNVSVDFVAFGDATGSETRDVLEKFVEAVGGSGSNEGNYLAVIPPGPGLLSDSLVTTPIVNSGAPQEGGMEGVESTGGAGQNNFEFGIDPATDPELAMALRMSMEEEQNRLERERRQREESGQNGERMETITEEGGSSANDSKQPRVEDDKSDGKS
ncbi:proteasome regulatory particle base subunit rpn10 [Knufia obscura]|uniref:Proteasome regulatory particle base subunit rpn10 n=2 Tax=Knufia TaxID=430999 RepID=A0AAN8I394_9EURO|nr:proteasome regulatory particle base subunit rpn10 [Knufia obscura]KAK5948081.1 proteasome regulatory particle base subunit rpn10 [Knufia fluminis]